MSKLHDLRQCTAVRSGPDNGETATVLGVDCAPDAAVGDFILIKNYVGDYRWRIQKISHIGHTWSADCTYAPRTMAEVDAQRAADRQPSANQKREPSL